MKLKLTYLFLIIIAILSGHYLGNACIATHDPMLEWLGKSLQFGFDPATIGLSAFTFTIGFRIAINFLQVMFIALAIVLAPKVAEAIK
ncbi:MAG: DUF4321 domain-containing protein [Oscillospiraceae bacterium]|nr:DUF4321 domain-containing protein [Oscillospiraceae bacterium]